MVAWDSVILPVRSNSAQGKAGPRTTYLGPLGLCVVIALTGDLRA